MKDTCCHKVLKILVDAKRNNSRWELQKNPPEYGPPGYLPIYAFQGAIRDGKGGSSGDKRLRDLRYKFIIPIKKICYIWESNKSMRTWLYSLDVSPEAIDIENRCVKTITESLPKANQLVLEIFNQERR